MAGYGFTLVVHESVRLSVRPSVHFSFPDNNLSKHQWIFTELGMCIDIVQICLGMLMAKFRQFLTELSARPYFRFQTITSVNNKGFSPKLLYALTLRRSGLGLLMGKFCQIFMELSARDTPILSFPDDNFSK